MMLRSRFRPPADAHRCLTAASSSAGCGADVLGDVCRPQRLLQHLVNAAARKCRDVNADTCAPQGGWQVA